MRLLRQLATSPSAKIAERFAAADRRDSQSRHVLPGAGRDRRAGLAAEPDAAADPRASEWREIERGVIQRAELIERVLADVYGEGKLIAEGALPAAALTGSADFVAAMRGVKPPGERWLRLYAADIGRGPDGRLVGARRPRAGALGFGLRAGEPAGRLAGLSRASTAR